MFVGTLRTDAANGHETRGEVTLQTTDVSVVEDIAEVRGCLLDGVELVDADGSLVAGANPVPYVVRFVLVPEGGTWKVSEFNTRNNDGEQTPCELTE